MTDTAHRAPLLAIRGLSKSFGSVQALTDVDFEVRPRRGDGPRRRQRRRQVDADQVRRRDPRLRLAARSLFDGKPVTIHGPKDAAKLGIEVVYQDLALCDNLDVVQNMYLGREARDWLYRLKEPIMESEDGRDAEDRSAVTTIRSIRQPVATLSGGQRQSVAVARAVHVELAPRHPRRADGSARRRADAAGARARQAARRARASPSSSSRTTCMTSSRSRTASPSCGSAATSACTSGRTTTQQEVVHRDHRRRPDQGRGHRRDRRRRSRSELRGSDVAAPGSSAGGDSA